MGAASPGLHAFGTPMIGITLGDVIVAWKFTRDHALPILKRSLWAFVTPHFVSCCTAQSPASSNSGDPTSLGPYRSVSQNIVSMTCDLFRPSSRIFAMAAVSTDSVV